MRMRHADGTIIDAPKAGVPALLALGWEPIDSPAGKSQDDSKGSADKAETASEDGKAPAKPATQKRGTRRQVPKPGYDD